MTSSKPTTNPGTPLDQDAVDEESEFQSDFANRHVKLNWSSVSATVAKQTLQLPVATGLWTLTTPRQHGAHASSPRVAVPPPQPPTALYSPIRKARLVGHSDKLSLQSQPMAPDQPTFFQRKDARGQLQLFLNQQVVEKMQGTMSLRFAGTIAFLISICR
jgi:hypothetical protein